MNMSFKFSKESINLSAEQTKDLSEDPICSDTSCDIGHNVLHSRPNTTQNLSDSIFLLWPGYFRRDFLRILWLHSDNPIKTKMERAYQKRGKCAFKQLQTMGEIKIVLHYILYLSSCIDTLIDTKRGAVPPWPLDGPPAHSHWSFMSSKFYKMLSQIPPCLKAFTGSAVHGKVAGENLTRGQ